MQVVLLAAGNSTRFVPFNSSFIHKSMVKILGKTLLEHTLEAINRSGIKDVVIVVGKDSLIEEKIGSGKKYGLEIKYVILKEALGMGAAILAAKEFLQDKFFVLNAHHLEFDVFAKEMTDLQKANETVVLLGKNGNEFEKYGFMSLKGDKVTEVVEKPEKNLQSWHRIVGIYLLNKKFLEVLDQTPLAHYHLETALSTFAKTNDVRALITEKKTLTLKYGWDLLEIKDYLLDKIQSYISKTAEISKTAVIKGKVFIDDGVTIMDGAKIIGPCFIGKNAYVGTNALVRNKTSIEENAVVGSFIELKNVLLMDNSTTHTGVLEDSIIGKNCKIAAGVISANVRLDRGEIFTVVKDEKINTHLTSFGILLGNNVQMGVRVTTMPGTIIGPNSLIGPYTTVMKNLAQNTKYYTVFKEVREEVRNEEK